MNKGFKITLIVLLSIVAIGLSVLLALLINNNFKFDNNFINIFNGQSNTLVDSKEYKIDDIIGDIYINSDVADIYINNSDDNIIKVELYSDNVRNHNIELSNNDLKIDLEDNNKFFFTKQSRIVLYVPKEFNDKFEITDNAGDIKASNFENASFKIKVTTGDVKIDRADVIDVLTTTGDIYNNNVNIINVVCTTGDIELGNINKSLNLKTTTGDIEIESINLSENSNIETTTGDVKIDDINEVYVETETKTGDVRINDNDRYADYKLHIKVTTGDIKVG